MTETVERLSRADLSYLRYETVAAPMQTGALLIVDGATLLDANGVVRLHEVRERIDVRLPKAPILRRRLHRPGPLQGRPVWIDDPSFDIERHVRLHTLMPPGRREELLAAAGQLISRPLPRSRPLWELWVIDGLGDGHMAMLLKLHHAIADGLAALTLLGALLDVDPAAPDPPPVAFRPRPVPAPSSLFVDNLAVRLSAGGHVVRALGHPAATWQAMRAVETELRRAIRMPAAPRISINQPVRPGRRFLFTALDLQEVRTIAHAGKGTINDVVLNLVAGGLRELLLSRGEPVGQPLIASVPVSLRSAAEAGTLGNAVGTLAVPLDVGEPDARRRLATVVRASRQAKAQQHPAQIGAAMAWLAATPLAQRFVTRQRLVNVFITNVVGPSAPMYMLGARILDALPLVSPVGNVAVAFCAFSYAGSLYLVATVDASACPDLDRVIIGVRRTWSELLRPEPPSPMPCPVGDVGCSGQEQPLP